MDVKRTGERLRALVVRPVFASALAVVALVVIGAAAVPGFLSQHDVDSILVLSSFLCIAAAGQTFVVILGGIDLSIPGTIGLGEVATTVLTSEGVPFWQIVVLLIGAGVVIGLLNGGTSSVFHVHPLIVSLGVGFIVTGGVLVWTSGGATQGSAPPVLTDMVSIGSKIGPLPVPPVVGIWAAVIVVSLVVQRRTRFGREMYALGSNAVAGRLALCRRTFTWVVAFVISAWAGEVAGILLGGFSGGANFDAGSSYLFLSIAAVVVGGTSLLGGVGGYGQTVLGSVAVILITTILVGVGVNVSLQEALLGVFIIIVVALTSREGHVRMRI